MIPFRRMIPLALLLGMVLSGCATAETPATSPQPIPSRTGQLTPYHYEEATDTPAPENPVTPTPLPSPTPTPRSYTIVRGDDLFGIALRFNVSLDDLLKMNPNVNAQFLKVGDTLVIPASTLPPRDVTPQPTPMMLPLEQPACYPTQDGGAWCFVLATNDKEFAVESLSATIRLADQGASQVFSQTAFAALNQALPGSTLPLMAYFPPPVPNPPFQASAELDAALPVSGTSQRYLPVKVDGKVDGLSDSGHSAQVSGTVTIGETDQTAKQVWVAAAAFDPSGKLVGVRRWEKADLSLAGGQSLPFAFQVYSAGPAIDRVEFWAEAQP